MSRLLAALYRKTTLGILLALAAVCGCSQPAKDGGAEADSQPFPRWCDDLGPLAVTQGDINPQRNWYLPATLTGLDLSRPLWERVLDPAGNERLVYARDVIYYATALGHAGAVDARSGQPLWRSEREKKREAAPSRVRVAAPALTEWSLAVVEPLAGDSSLIHFLAPTTGELLRTVALAFRAHELLASGRYVIALGGEGQAVTLDASDGSILGEASVALTPAGALAVDESLLMLGAEGNLHALSLPALNHRRARILEEHAWNPLLLNGELLLFTSAAAAEVVSLAPQTLGQNWRSPVPRPPMALPAGCSGRVYYGEITGWFRCFDLGQKRFVWSRDLEAPCYIFMAFDNCVMAVAEYAAPRTEPGDEVVPADAPSWYRQPSELSRRVFVLDNSTGNTLSAFSVPGGLNLTLVTPYGIVARKEVAGAMRVRTGMAHVCFPAQVTLSEGSR